MGRQRSPNRDKARALWEQNPEQKLKDIAAHLGVSEGQIKKWKSLDAWGNNKVTLVTKNGEVTNKKTVEHVVYETAQENAELSDQEKDFCFHLSRIRNATTAAIRAGYSKRSAKQLGSRLWQKPEIKAEVARLRKLRMDISMLVDADDILDLYMRAAFADMSDFMEFGTEERTVIGEMGEVISTDPETGEKKPLTYTANYIRFKDCEDVDGQLISEVRQGRDGVSVKLVDRMRAWDWLTKYFEAHPGDRRKADFDARRLAIEEHRADISDKNAGEVVNIVDDL